MTTRNRTNKFIELRDGFRSHSISSGDKRDKSRLMKMKRLAAKGKNAILSRNGSEDKQGLLEGKEDDIELGPIEPETPDWIREVGIIKDNISKIKQKKEELHKEHSKQLRVAFGDEETGRQNVNVLTSQLQTLFRDSEHRIMVIGQRTPGTHKQEIIMKENIQRALATELSLLSTSFRKDQTTYMHQLQGQDARTKFAVSEEDTTEFDQEFQQSAAGLSIFTEQMDVDKRHEEIEKITESINELAGMFKEMAVLVIDQGTIIDRIDYNVELVHKHTQQAKEELDKVHRRVSAKKLFGCTVCLAIAVGVMTIVLFVKIINKFL